MKMKLVYILLAICNLQSVNLHAQNQWAVFTTQNSPLPSNFVGSIAVDTNNIKWIGTALGMVRIEGNNWMIYDTTNTPLGDNSISPKTIDIFNNLWVSVAYKGIAKFDGANWIIYDTTNSGLPSNATADIKTDVYNVKWIATNRGLAKFNDTSWVIYDTSNSGIPSNGLVPITIDGHIKWIGTFDKGIGRFNDTTWTIYNIYNSGLPGNFIWDIKIDYTGSVWITTHFSGLAKFNYSLNQWTVYNTTNSGIPSNNLYKVLIYGHNKWIGTQESGLAYYNDTNWVVFNFPLPSNSVLNLGLDSNKNLWICTDGGLAIYNATGIVGINNNQNFPSNIALYQNYPNPFNVSTKIKYELPQNSHVIITVFDITGRTCGQLLNVDELAGSYEVIFNANNFASGIYFYKLETEYFTETKKMVLLK
jgi:ligand-binding sensor domain-containing protein